ncbi:unnamed protein product [Symbiodinium pilosum]|uniref:C3H1-type domain-containing protein n=1 Tax=Symbiodinium pilosum TaxID=2952 RepID=A0A812PGX7_SYMPI|nr:unnamed protein product [Symbiodinium pilosum]
MTFSTLLSPMQIRIADLIDDELPMEAQVYDQSCIMTAEGAFGSSEEDEDPPILQQVLPSKGSVQHGTGHCKPCAWFWKLQGCKNGADCRHCHLCPETEVKDRKRRKAHPKASGVLRPPPGLESLSSGQSQSTSDTDCDVQRRVEPSLGALLHSSGQCKPCMWFWKIQGCARGQACLHCHLCPPGEVRRRRKLRRVPTPGAALAAGV